MFTSEFGKISSRNVVGKFFRRGGSILLRLIRFFRISIACLLLWHRACSVSKTLELCPTMSGLSFGVESNALFIILDRDTAVYIYTYISSFTHVMRVSFLPVALPCIYSDILSTGWQWNRQRTVSQNAVIEFFSHNWPYLVVWSQRNGIVHNIAQDYMLGATEETTVQHARYDSTHPGIITPL